MGINIIVAIGKNNEIGCNNCLLAHLPNDLKYFKEVTKGHIVIMGRKTLESLPNGNPLKGRVNIVISRTDLDREDVLVAKSIEESIEIAEKVSKQENKEIFVIGGASIYGQFMDKADKLYITHMFNDFVADTYFPEIDKSWNLDSVKADVESITCDIPHLFAIYSK